MNRTIVPLEMMEYHQTLGGAIVIERLLAKYRLGGPRSDELVIAHAVHAMRLKLPEKIVQMVFWFLV